MSTSLLQTKLYIPPSRESLVSRERLINQLDEGCQRKLTLISAPAGYGKSTLLSHSGGIRDGFTNRSGEDIDSLPDYLAPGGEAPTITIQEMLEGAPGVMWMVPPPLGQSRAANMLTPTQTMPPWNYC